MQTIKFIYEDQEIDFSPNDNENIMVNATEMARLFDKEVSGFLKIENTEKFIKALSQTEDLPFENEFSPSGKLIKIIKGHSTINGTWMRREVALKFAAWLDPYFEVWVYKTIDTILLGHYREMKEAAVERYQAEKELKKKKEELLLKNPDLIEIFDIELKINNAEKKRIKALKAAMAQLKLDM